MIANKFLTFVKKNLFFFNIFLITVLISFYFLNPQKFDTYKIYLTYDFDERKMLNRGEPFQFVANFLSELSFSDDFKRNLETDNSKLSDKVNVQINLDINQIRFDFSYKAEVINNKNALDKAEKISDITKSMEFAIANYHKRLKVMLIDKRIEALGGNKNDFFNIVDGKHKSIPFSEFLNAVNNSEVLSVQIQGKNIKWFNLQNNSFSTHLPHYPNLIDILTDKGVSITVVPTKLDSLNVFKNNDGNIDTYFTPLQEEYLNLLNNDQKIIMIKGYNEKFRRLFLNTDEYIISALIFLILFNFLVRNSSNIFK